MLTYAEFIAQKSQSGERHGFAPLWMPDFLFDFQKHLVEVAPWIWLYNGYEYTAQQPYVQGFVPSPTDSLVSFRQVTLER